MNARRLYLLLGLACAVGFAYLMYASANRDYQTGFGPCMFKNVTGIPCPSCGSTRSVLLVADGNLPGAIALNPLGLFLATGLILVPLWIGFDLVTRRKSLYAAWQRLENALKIKWVAVIAILLIVANWIWNIYKDL